MKRSNVPLLVQRLVLTKIDRKDEGRHATSIEIDWKKERIYLFGCLHIFSWNKMYKSQTGQETKFSAHLVTALRKTILDHSIECHIPTTFGKIFRKGPYNQQCIKYWIFHKNFCLIIRLFKQVWRYQFIRFQPIVAFAQGISKAFFMHHGTVTGCGWESFSFPPCVVIKFYISILGKNRWVWFHLLELNSSLTCSGIYNSSTVKILYFVSEN